MVSTAVDRLRAANSSLGVKAPCLLATTANITLSGNQTIDGVMTVNGDRILVKNQIDQTENGIYVADSGTWERAPDFDGNEDVVTGTTVRVAIGTVNVGSWYYVTTTGAITIGTSNIVFAVIALGTANQTFTGQTSFPDGSAAAPSVRIGDEQNGFFSGPADQLSISIGGTAAGLFNTTGFNFFRSNIGGNVAVISQNLSDTANSTARLSAIVAGTSAGDPFTRYVIGSTASFATGQDNSDSDSYKVSYAASGSASLGTNDFFVITTGGIVKLCGNVSPTGATGAVIADGSVSLIVGADAGARTLTNSTTKTGRIATPHYLNAEEPLGVISGTSGSAENLLQIGGGTVALNATTRILFYTATGTTTTAGTVALEINGSQNITASADLTVTDDLFVVGHGTTGTSANAVLDSGTGELLRSTSSLKYKRDVAEMTLDEARAVILGLQPITYISTSDRDDQTIRMPGFAAEQVAEIDPRFVHFAHEFRKVTEPKKTTERRQKTERKPVEETTVEIVDGNARMVTKEVMRDTPLFTDHPVFDDAGKPVMVESQQEVRDRKGNVIQPRILMQAMHREPVMEEVEVETQVTRREQVSAQPRPDGVQYAALVVPLIKTIQDLEARVRGLEER